MNKLRSGHIAFPNTGINLLSQDELYMIHQATINILETVGVKVLSDKAIEYFDGAGCFVNRADHIVKIPAHVVEDAIRTTPSTFTLYGRTPEHTFEFGSGVNFTNFGEGIRVTDLDTRVPRPTRKKDVAEAALMCDAMENVAFIERPVGADEAPAQVQTLHNAEAILNNTTKACMLPAGSAYNTQKIAEMAATIDGSMEALREKPRVFNVVCPKSPLTLNDDLCEVIIKSGELGMPAMVLSMAMAGGTGPVTLAGTLVTHNAEVLAGITLNQLVTKGSKNIYGSSTTMMDLRTTTSPVGTPETALLSAAVAQLGAFYQIPTFVAGG